MTRPLVFTLIIIITCTQAFFIFDFYKKIKFYGTSWGDFGNTGYIDKQNAVKYIIETSKGSVFTVSSTGVNDSENTNFSFSTVPPDYWYLLKLYYKNAVPEENGKKYHFVINGSDSAQKNLKYLEYIGSRPFGSLRVHQYVVDGE